MERFPSKYLRLLLGVRLNSKEIRKLVIENFEARLMGRKSRMLVIIGKVTLIKSVLTTLLIFYMSMFRMPMSVKH